ncbi:MAG: hypothetical protein GSR86_04115 [Desulfurococcales archaeon]|nr:hypothetical protein [Desulfurococcales archaeon]
MVRIAGKIKHIPDSILESIAMLHGAVDPDTGHLICHHYPLGLALIEAGGRSMPALGIGECIYLVPPPYADLLVGDARSSALEQLGEDTTSMGGAVVDTPAIALVLSVLREEKGSIRLYTVPVEVDGRESRAVLARLKLQNEAWGLLVTPCKQTRIKEHENLYY